MKVAAVVNPELNGFKPKSAGRRGRTPSPTVSEALRLLAEGRTILLEDVTRGRVEYIAKAYRNTHGRGAVSVQYGTTEDGRDAAVLRPNR